MQRFLIAAVAFAAVAGMPAAAMARAGYAVADVNMRAGPSTAFPAVTTIPAGAGVNIHGCLDGYDWCDVGWAGDRGWVEGEYLQFLYHERRVLLPSYAAVIGLPIIAFSVDTYWHRHYRHRSWYHRRAYWRRHYRRHSAHVHHARAHHAHRNAAAQHRNNAARRHHAHERRQHRNAASVAQHRRAVH
ncbi:MAG: SH3 domain-containing protein, partial [Pseudolabrys sp.]